MATSPRRPKQQSRAPSVQRLAADIAPLARQISRLQERAAALGVFVDDRGLLECPKCGLVEDVGADGRLFTTFDESFGRDTGLRFAATKKANVFRCPSCGADVLAPEETDP